MLYDPSSDAEPGTWEAIFHYLQTRASNYCEAGTPDCLAADLSGLDRRKVSVHHRAPRKMGGTRDPYINALSNLLLVCGHGTVGCHGWLESHRNVARDTKGWLVPRIGTERPPTESIPVVVPFRPMPVYLWDDAAIYLTAPLPPVY